MVGGEPLAESRSKKPEALLAYVAIESDRAHRRENLAGLLFPDMLEEQARTNLRKTLSRLRRAISDDTAGEPFLLSSRESTRFNLESDHFLDTATFERLLLGCSVHHGRRDGYCADCLQRAQEATALYRGPFLDGFFLEDSVAFDDWILERRLRYQEEALHALTELASYHEKRGEYQPAAQFARQQISIEPWREEAHRQLMRCLAYQGQRNSALHQYEVLKALLLEELAVEPMVETEALRRQIVTIKDKRPHRLPPRDSSFVGRQSELAQINQHLADPDRRLVTLVGPGGSGKTALATEASWRIVSRYLGPFMQGAFFVSLAGIGETGNGTGAEGDQLAFAVSESLNFSLSADIDPNTQLVNYLRDKSLLIILDNMEHLAEQGRDFVHRLLRDTHSPGFLVTSRIRLNLAQEWILQVAGLTHSLALGEQTSLSGDETEAIELFEKRARQVVPDFQLSNGEIAGTYPCHPNSVTKISQLVQGLPLGIELAASWVRYISCQEIADEIQKNLDFLSTTQRDTPQRHQSLRAVFDYSWTLLTESEQIVVSKLSVFGGAFDRQAALVIAGASIRQLATLIDSSWLQRRKSDDPHNPRYELLEISRQFAAEKLHESPGAEESSVRSEHASFYLDFLSNRLEDLRGSRQQTVLLEIAQEIVNIRQAWRWAAEQGDSAALSSALETLALFYYMRSWFAEGEKIFAQAIDLMALEHKGEQERILYGRLLAWQGWFKFLGGRQQEGQSLLEQGVERLRSEQDPCVLAHSLGFLSVTTYTLGDFDSSHTMALEALALSQEEDDNYGMAIVNNVLSQICYLLGRYAEAEQFGEQSLELARRMDNRWSLGFSLVNLGRVAFAKGDFDEAEAYYQEAMLIREELGDYRGQALGLQYLGDTALVQDELHRARQVYQESLVIFQDIGSQASTAAILVRLGDVERIAQSQEAAHDHYKEALQLADNARVIPGMLDALVGIAQLLAAVSPEEAREIAQLVAHHPATSETSRTKAIALLISLAEEQSEGERSMLTPTEADARLESLAAPFLD